jgi:anti-sigma factor ChrR (cupin superfamily)
MMPPDETIARWDISVLREGRESWPELRPGVRIRVLHEGPGEHERVALLSYSPGAQVESHLHNAGEHIIILEGSQEDENGSFGPGTYMYNAPGTRHSVKAPVGCLVWIHWQGSLDFSPVKS